MLGLKYLSSFVLVMAAFFSFAIFSSSTENNSSKDSYEKNKTLDSRDDLPQIIKAIDLDSRTFSFAGEDLPMDNFDVRERLDRELMRNSYWHSNTILNVKKAYRYFPIIEPILAENNIPNDFKYLAVAESDLSNAVSPAGAKGFWQFMKGTAGDYGLQVNSEVDERYNLEKATKAACKFLQKQYDRFGSWALVAAAYNMGAYRLDKEMKVQRAKSYFDLNLNQETSRYLFRIIAIKEILSNPRDFGFYVDEIDRYQPMPEYKTIEVSSGVANWGDFALKHGTTYRMLKVYNPWLISSTLTNKAKKTYQIRIPK